MEAKNVKRAYEAPKMEVTHFDAEDIILESGTVMSNYILNHGGVGTGAVSYDLLK